ncbi:SbmA/BacA-like family transporter [Bradyrhizobium viridifuturi]|uniref:SbmA/BacA-like family transporter n=1 Tax=Bradyrhizobium viridifuturi TaxID=1654716 RepID=UPI00067EE78B|nr:SbmA/BacA-like family transporter [Bradyrhizobium viridifuturi]
MILDQSLGEPSKEWSRFWESASAFWRGPSARQVWLLCASLVVIVVLQLYTQFLFNYWNRDFFDALEARDAHRLQTQAVRLIPLCLASIALAVTSVWGRMTVQRRWREWLSLHLISYWVENDRYARLAQVQVEQQIPEYRIAEDARIATDAPIDFALGLVSSLLTAIIFLQVLWSVGGSINFTVYGHGVWIPGYLVVGVVVYSSIATSAMLVVGSPLPGVIQLKNQSEAELITAAHLLRDIGEGITSREQEAGVKRALGEGLQNALTRWRHLCWQLMRTTLVSQGNSLLAPVMGLVLCAPKFLAGAMTLGELTQAAAAFTLVQGSFNWLVDNYGRVADWDSSLERVGGLLLALDQLDHATPAEKAAEPAIPAVTLTTLP